MPHSGTDLFGASFQVAGRGERQLGFAFNVTVIEHVGALVSHEVFNQFDEAGLLLSLERLPGERNADYKRRLLDVHTRRANATYKGLIYGITRELGLQIYSPFQISAVRVAGVMLGRNSVVEFDGPQVRVWGDSVLDTTPELAIDRFDMDIGTLVSRINTSLFVRASAPLAAVSSQKAMRIMNQSTLTKVTAEVLKDSIRNQLVGRNIVEGSLFFSGTDSFRTRVNTAAEVTSTGRYFLDRTTGDLISFDSAGPVAVARYQYINDPMQVVASPVILHNIQDPLFRDKMFDQILQDDGTLIEGLSTPLGTDIINELLTVKGMLWGE